MPIESLSSRLFGQVGIDFMTDLPKSEGFYSIMVIVDLGLSKGVILTPCSKTGLIAQYTVQLYINNVYAHFGLPDKMISDRGPQFDSQFWKELCEALQIKHAMTTAFHPQTNGGTEHVNHEIQMYLFISASTTRLLGSKHSKRQNLYTTIGLIQIALNPLLNFGTNKHQE